MNQPVSAINDMHTYNSQIYNSVWSETKECSSCNNLSDVEWHLFNLCLGRHQLSGERWIVAFAVAHRVQGIMIFGIHNNHAVHQCSWYPNVS